MVGYKALETAVITHLLSVFPDELTDTTAVSADSDALLREIFNTGATYGCLIDMGNPAGRDQRREPFKERFWSWQMIGVFMIRYNEDIETQARDVVDKLATLFQSDHTLGGLTPKASMMMVDAAEPTQINDVAFYLIFFAVEVWDR